MVERVKLTDRKLKGLKPAAPGQRYEVMDTVRPRLGVRVTDSGHRSFIYFARFPGSTNPTRRTINETSLADAREVAEQWDKLIAKGKDPREEAERQRREELRKRADSFEAAVEAYAKRVLATQRRGHIVARELRKFFAEPWRGRAITSIERQDVIDAVAERPMYQAHALFGHVRALFNWAIEAGAYGIEHSPCDRIRPKRLLGERKPRVRVLNDNELKAFWHAAEAMGYPYGPLYQLLLLTGCRRMEMGGARWREIDEARAVLTVPPERFKSETEHLVPLSNTAMEILKTLPRFTNGDYLFSSSFGVRPVSGFIPAKDRIDKVMAAEPWRVHDLRRTMRTRLAGLKVPDMVAELVIGHGKRGLQRVYDQHQYEAEMREALEQWAARLRDIVAPPPENVVKLPKARHHAGAN